MEKPLQTQLGLFRGLVKSQLSPISPNPQAAFRPFFFCPFNLLRMVRLLHLELLAASPAKVKTIKEKVMAKVIEFYVPKNFRNAFVRAG